MSPRYMSLAFLLCLFTDFVAGQGSDPECTAVFTGVRPREIALSPCGKYLAVAGYEDGTVEANALLVVWDLKTKKEVFRHREPQAGCYTVSFSPDGKRLAAAGGSSLKTAKVWEFPSGKEIAQLHNTENVQCLRFSWDGKLLAMATFIKDEGSHAVMLWETEKFQKKSILKGPERNIWSVAFSSNSKLLASADAFGAVHLWNVDEEKLLASIPGGQDDWANAVCFSKSGRMFVSVHQHGRIRLFDPANPEAPPTVLKGQDAGIRQVLFGPDDHWLFTAGGEFPSFKHFGPFGTVQLWNVPERRLSMKFKAHTLPVLTMALSSDGETLITASMDATVKVWRRSNEWYSRKSPEPK